MVKIYEIYEKADIRSLPVDPVESALAEGIRTVSYASVAEVYCRDIEGLYRDSRFGFSFNEGDSRIIAVNERSCSERRRRFTVAHELGHCLLGHLDDGRKPGSAEERAADCFAADLLAPLSVLNFCGVTSPEEIARICGLSKKAAAIRFEELCRRRASGYDFLEGEENVRIVRQFSRYITERLCRREESPGVVGRFHRY